MRICGYCVRVSAGVSVRLRVRISNRLSGGGVKLVNYSLITALPVAASANRHIRFIPVASLNSRNKCEADLQ